MSISYNIIRLYNRPYNRNSFLYYTMKHYFGPIFLQNILHINPNTKIIITAFIFLPLVDYIIYVNIFFCYTRIYLTDRTGGSVGNDPAL